MQYVSTSFPSLLFFHPSTSSIFPFHQIHPTPLPFSLLKRADLQETTAKHNKMRHNKTRQKPFCCDRLDKTTLKEEESQEQLK